MLRRRDLCVQARVRRLAVNGMQDGSGGFEHIRGVIFLCLILIEATARGPK